jgi:hypothetical protein
MPNIFYIFHALSQVRNQQAGLKSKLSPQAEHLQRGFNQKNKTKQKQCQQKITVIETN